MQDVMGEFDDARVDVIGVRTRPQEWQSALFIIGDMLIAKY